LAFLLSQLLTDSAAKNRSKEALDANQRTMTYGEMDGLSNRMARSLRHRGVKRGDRVAIYLDKSIEAVVSIFAVLKADATYVPLDPGAPVPRLAYITHNSEARVLISSPSKRQRIERIFAEDQSMESLVLVDESTDFQVTDREVISWADVLGESSDDLEQRNTENDLAYILYTSGSTGDPKGVMISHRNALAFVDWAFEAMELSDKDRVSSHAPFHFDLSIFDIFATIEAAATLCLIPPDAARFPTELGRWIAAQRITVWYSVPSALVLLLQRGQLAGLDLSSLRAVMFAGEVFPTKHLRSLMEQIPAARYFNLYGPTETNVVTWFRLTEPPAGDEPIPIGKACANMEVFLLNEAGELVTEPSKQGELYARGPTVARGYCEDPDQTAKVFLSNPLDRSDPTPVYKTGDLATLDAAGNILFLGRVDQQVKVQGYRIELGEVETAIMSHADVEEAAVLALDDSRLGAYLKAFVVVRTGHTLATDEIKRHCSTTLPAYMIPATIDLLAGLPKTSTGKTDRVELRKRG